MSTTGKNCLEVSSEYGPFYNSGKISVTGEHLVCTYKSQVNIVCRDTGKTLWTIPLGELSVTCTQLSPDGQKLVVADTSLNLQLFNLKTKEPNGQTWRSLHLNHIRCMVFNEAGNLLATGGTDSSIKIWDTDYRFCTHSFKRGGTGVITCLIFQPFGETEVRLFSGADNGEICLFDLRKKSAIQNATHHSSAVTDMVLSEDNKTLISAGRDSIVTLWNADKLTLQKTVAVFEAIESLLLVTKYYPKTSGHCFLTAGSDGTLKVWDSAKGNAILTENCGQHNKGIHQICHVPVEKGSDADNSSLVVVGNEFIISLHDVSTLKCHKQFCGFFDDVLEVKYFGSSEEFLAVANNSANIIVYTISTWGCQILRGHSDIVVGLEVSPSDPQLMASCSKDNSFRLWQVEPEGSITCVAVGLGHTLSVEAVAFSRSAKLMFSVSSDCMLKLWRTPAQFDADEVVHLKTKLMKNAHTKPISCLAVSPNDGLVVTGSEDHMAKLWCGTTLDMQGVLKGHKHGLTSVQFSPVDKCVVTASRDRTVRIWRITDLSAAMVLEHDMPVMKLILMSKGRQVLSGTSDGYLNIWDVLTQTLQGHLEGHSQHAWAIDVSKDCKQIVSGGSDSIIKFWQDVTDRDKMQELEEKEDYISKEQSLSNALKSGKLKRALHLALDLDKPQNVYNIVKDLISMEENDKLSELVSNLAEIRKKRLVEYLIKWNTNSLYSDIGQFLLQKILDTSLPSDHLMTKQQCRDLQAYTERHYKKRKLLDEKIKFIPYLLRQMNSTGFTDLEPLGTNI